MLGPEMPCWLGLHASAEAVDIEAGQLLKQMNAFGMLRNTEGVPGGGALRGSLLKERLSNRLIKNLQIEPVRNTSQHEHKAVKR